MFHNSLRAFNLCNFVPMEESFDISEQVQNLDIKRPQEGFQMRFAASNADIIFGGGAAGGGKSVALILANGYSLMTDGDFRMLISRRSLQNQKAGGGFVEKFKEFYGEYCTVKESDSPRVTFESGAFCDLTYIDDSNMPKLRERAKGWEYDVICMDELTEMTWEGFTYLMTRNRGRSKTCTGKIYATMNPKRSCWIRKFIDWYIAPDGTIREDADGVVRFFYVNGSTVDDVVWGNSKEEVYRKCRADIDRKLMSLGHAVTYKNLIKSFVFYQGLIKENKVLIDSNADYAGSIAASGGKTAQALLEGNWNVDPEEEEDIPIRSEDARKMFTEDPAVNGEKWITVDLADYGENNFIALLWNGFHVEKMLAKNHTTPRENAMLVKTFAQENGVPETHVIYDGTSGRYFGDYLPEAICYLSSSRSIGMYALLTMTLKDNCYLRLTKMIQRGGITVADSVAMMQYTYGNTGAPISVSQEIMEECSVVRFHLLQGGRRKLWSKKEMNSKLGKGRSMDVLDPMAMRMYPCCAIEYGSELEQGFADYEREEIFFKHERLNIYDNTIWS